MTAAFAAHATSWDTSGNSMLNGTYYFRQVLYVLGDVYGDLGQGIALYGNITFNGNGSYTISAAVDYECTSSGCGTGPAGSAYTTSGTYSIAGSGYGFISNPFTVRFGSTVNSAVYGLVSANGIFVSSSTESGINDIFIAAPLDSPLPTASSFTGTWTCAYMDPSYPGYPTSEYAETAMFNLTPNGKGQFGLSAQGYFGGSGAAAYSQTGAGLAYIFSNGAAVATFPTNGTLLTGQEYLYFAKDGSFVFGGAPNAFDMIVGVPTASGTPNFSGLYYEAGVDEAGGDLDTYYGSFYAVNNNILAHDRVQYFAYGSSGDTTYDSTFSSPYTLSANGSATIDGLNYVVGSSGVRIGAGTGSTESLEVAFPAPTPSSSLSTTGVFLSPIEVRNAGSWAPFTEGIAPGELLVLRGSGLAPDGLQIAQAAPFGPSMAGVQVSIGGLPAPIYYVSPTQMSVIVPYAVSGPIVPVQVNYNGTLSNVVTMYLRQSAAGVLTQTASGLGYAAMEHADYSLVTQANPAQAGEQISIYMTGLGAVSPPITDGAPGPVSPYSLVPSTAVAAYVGGVQATIGYAGLAPTLAGLYQLNINIPSGLTAGDNYLEVDGADSSAVSALIPIGSSSTSSPDSRAKPAAAATSEPPMRRFHRPGIVIPPPNPQTVPFQPPKIRQLP